MLALGGIANAFALPPNPIREAARLNDVVCENPAGVQTHGSWVSGVARHFYPTDPIAPCEIFTDS